MRNGRFVAHTRPSGTVIFVGIIVLMMAMPIAGVAIARTTDDRPLLSIKQDRAFPLFEQTARLVDPAYETHPFLLDNPGTPFDHANDPWGYDHCDDWESWILPGWSAFAIHDFSVANASERSGIIRQVRSLWEQQDGTLSVHDVSDARPLRLQIDEASYQLTFPVNQDFATVPDGTVTVSIGCLPAD